MGISDRWLLPLASLSDAERTVAAVIDVSDRTGDRPVILPIHVIEKGGGAIDKIPVDVQKEQAEDLFIHAVETLDEAGFTIEPHVVYGTDVVEAIIQAARDEAASAIVFLPREGGTLSKLLAGDLSNRLIVESPIPVITLPQPAG